MKRQLLKVFSIMLTALSILCCSSAARYGVLLTSGMMYDCIKTFSDSLGTRTVVLIPMNHVARTSDYKKIENYLDTLRAHGYVTFNEGLLPSSQLTDTLDIPLYREAEELYSPVDSMKLDTLRRKLRKIAGVYPALKLDEIAARKNKVKQPSSLLEFADQDYWVDETYADIIKDFEITFGEIELSQYDFECPLDSDNYKGKMDKRWQSVRSSKNAYCNVRLARCIFDTDFDKIAVMFGYSHIHKLYWFVLPDNGYVLTDNPYYQ